MVATTLNGVLLTGTHAARPAASAVAKGTLYACSTHALIYQSDGSSWSTWATLGTAGLSDPMTTRGDMIIRNASNATDRLGRGSSGEVLTSDGTDIAWAPPAGGSSSTSFLGYNTAGASWETLTTNRHYYKKFTLSAAGWVEVQAYLRPSVDNVAYVIGEIAADNAGEVGVLRAAQALGTTYLSNSSSMPGAGRWVSLCKAYLDAAGDYWAGFTNDQARFDLAYDGSGSDHTFTASLLTATGGYPTAWTITTGTRKYSIRVALLA